MRRRAPTHGNGAWERVAVAAGVIVAVAAVLYLGVWVPAVMEAAAYERATGQHVSPWDAIWLDLRVQAPPVAPAPAPERASD